MAEFRRAAHRLLGDEQPPETLWVVHSEATRAMAGHRAEPHLDLGGHYDWLLAAGTDHLGLFRVHGPRLLPEDLVFKCPYERLHVRYEDVGVLARSRVFIITEPGQTWFSVTAHLSAGRVRRVESFTELLLDRTRARR